MRTQDREFARQVPYHLAASVAMLFTCLFRKQKFEVQVPLRTFDFFLFKLVMKCLHTNIFLIYATFIAFNVFTVSNKYFFL